MNEHWTDAQLAEIDANFDKLEQGLEDGSIKQEMIDEAKAAGREWTAQDEEDWTAAMAVFGYTGAAE